MAAVPKCPVCKTPGVLRGKLRGYTYVRCPNWTCAHEWAVRGYVDAPEPAPVAKSPKRQAAAKRRVRAVIRRKKG